MLDQRIEFVIRALMQQESFLQLCREYGISTKTGYKWKERFLEKGEAGLLDESRRPQTSARTAEEIVCEIIRIKKQKNRWGPKKIRNLYETVIRGKRSHH